MPRAGIVLQASMAYHLVFAECAEKVVQVRIFSPSPAWLMAFVRL